MKINSIILGEDEFYPVKQATPVRSCSREVCQEGMCRLKGIYLLSHLDRLTTSGFRYLRRDQAIDHLTPLRTRYRGIGGHLCRIQGRDVDVPDKGIEG